VISGHLRQLAEAEYFAAERPYLLECTGPYQAVLSTSKEAISVQTRYNKPTEAEILRPYSSQQRVEIQQAVQQRLLGHTTEKKAKICWAVQLGLAGPYN
jgi:hypothetical protein